MTLLNLVKDTCFIFLLILKIKHIALLWQVPSLTSVLKPLCRRVPNTCITLIYQDVREVKLHVSVCYWHNLSNVFPD